MRHTRADHSCGDGNGGPGGTIRGVDKPPDTPSGHVRRRRYPGRNPRAFDDRYKELHPERYPEELEKILASGRTPAGSHRPIMVDEVLECLRPAAGEIAVDCTLGGGGHAEAMLARLQPGGRLVGIDVDPLERPRTEARLRAAGYGAETFTAHHANFARLPQVLAAEGLATVDLVLADLGVSSMQIDNPARGFSYKQPGPLDMRMNPAKGEPASHLLARASEAELEALLAENADEPQAAFIARLLKSTTVETTHALERLVRLGLNEAMPHLAKSEIKLSVRRTFQALRVAVNDEFAVLDALLRMLPHCLSPGGRTAILTFHSGEDRRVKKAFQAGQRSGLYADIAREVIRPSQAETYSNRRAQSAKLRWAVRA